MGATRRDEGRPPAPVASEVAVGAEAGRTDGRAQLATDRVPTGFSRLGRGCRAPTGRQPDPTPAGPAPEGGIGTGENGAKTDRRALFAGSLMILLSKLREGAHRFSSRFPASGSAIFRKADSLF